MKKGTILTAIKILIGVYFTTFITVTYSQTPNYEWASLIGGDQEMKTICDANGNIYFANVGNFYSNFGKQSANGISLWTKSLSAHENISGLGNPLLIINGLVVDNSGNLFITGRYIGIADFDPGVGTLLLTSGPLNSWQQRAEGGFIAKYDSNGNLLWAKSTETSLFTTCEPWSIAMDQSNNIVICGMYAGLVDFDPSSSVFNFVTDNSTGKAFFAKYDDLGNFIMAKSIGDNGQVINAKSIAIDVQNNIYLTGNFGLTSDFDPGIGTHILTSAGANDAFVAKYNSTGDYEWAYNFGTSKNGDLGKQVAIDHSGNIIFTGVFSNTVDFDPSLSTSYLTVNGGIGWDNYLLKLSSNGDFIWANVLGSQDILINSGWFGPNYVNYDNINCIAIDAADNIYVTGTLFNTVDFDPSIAVNSLTASGSDRNSYYAKYTPNGNFIWAFNIAGYTNGTSIAIDPTSSLITGGTFKNNVDFDPSSCFPHF